MAPDAMGRSPAELVRERLVVQDDVDFEDQLAKSETLFKLDSKGNVHPAMDTSKLANRQKIELILLGKRMARIGELVSDDTAKDSEMARFLGVSLREIQKRAHDLRVSGRIESVSPGSYRLVDGRVGEVLRDLGVP